MGSTFNPQILVEKLNKLNSTQASIETLSHWCIFHMNKAKQVVETWDTQFHCSPREQKLAFLYLANDILQNSRRKGSEFVGEFWKVLPGALREVIETGDEHGKNAARRLVGIWEERKVFGSRGQILKEELVGKHQDNNRNGKHLGVKLQKQPIGNTVDKIVSGYQVVYGGQMDEDVILTKCKNAIFSIEKIEKEIGGDIHSGQLHGSAFVEELQGHHATMRNCVEQLTAAESMRANLVSHLREALQEQESKLTQIRNERQTVQSQSEQAGNICRKLIAEHKSKEASSSMGPPGFIPADREQSAPVMFGIEEGPRKSVAAAVAAKLTASTSSAQMLSYVFSSLASEAINNNQSKESSGDLPPEKKRPKLDNDKSFTPAQNPQAPPIPPFTHLDSLQNNVTTTTQLLMTTTQLLIPNTPPPPPPSSPPPVPPPPPPPMAPQPYQVPQYTGSITVLPYSYNMTPPPPLNLPGYPSVSPPPLTGMSPFAPPPTNLYPSFQGSDGNFYSQPTSMAPVSRQ